METSRGNSQQWTELTSVRWLVIFAISTDTQVLNWGWLTPISKEWWSAVAIYQVILAISNLKINLLLAKKNMLRKDQNIPKLVTMLFKGVYYVSHRRDAASNYCYILLSRWDMCVFFVKYVCEMSAVIDNFVIVFLNQSRPARSWPELFLGVSFAN